jgi:diadenosine tetraphosphate (Ap4A) HIT family hydrolase
MTEEKCVFCNYNLIKENILWESDNFFVKVGVGIFAPGHVMITAKEHISCFGELPKELSKEFLLLKEYVFEKVKSNFSEPIIYEHGVYGQSVNHAHIQFIPNKSNFYHLERIKEKIFLDLDSTKIDDILQIMPVFKKDGSYLYLEENGQKWVFYTKGLQEGKYNFRREFARLTGLNGLSNWRHMPKEEKTRNKKWTILTKEKLALL